MGKPEVRDTDSQKAGQGQGPELIIKGREITFNAKFAEDSKNINIVLVRDPLGNVKAQFPTQRNPDTKRLEYDVFMHRAVEVPPEEVLFYTGSPVIDIHNTHSATITIKGTRTVVVFDRTYEIGGQVFQQCAWIPDKSVRAGIMFVKMINRQTRRPVAVMRKLGGSTTPAYQIVGSPKKHEAYYRDLRRIFERVFITGARPDNRDDELDNWMHSVIEPIPQETAPA
jgi:hypothetical protein